LERKHKKESAEHLLYGKQLKKKKKKNAVLWEAKNKITPLTK